MQTCKKLFINQADKNAVIKELDMLGKFVQIIMDKVVSKVTQIIFSEIVCRVKLFKLLR